jgi:phosphosulfolactate phosphohydrolase-like enzyme
MICSMRDALAELFDLVEGGWLVRNTTNDGHFPSFLKESTRLVGALSNARAVLRATAEGQP